MRFRCESPYPVQLEIQRWVRGGDESIRLFQTFSPGEITDEFDPENVMAKILSQHSEFKEHVLPTIYDLLAGD